jgi:hypothetical protein
VTIAFVILLEQERILIEEEGAFSERLCGGIRQVL